MTPDCALTLPNDPNLQIDATQIAIEMKKNVDIGQKVKKFCVKCSNNFTAITHSVV